LFFNLYLYITSHCWIFFVFILYLYITSHWRRRGELPNDCVQSLDSFCFVKVEIHSRAKARSQKAIHQRSRKQKTLVLI